MTESISIDLRGCSRCGLVQSVPTLEPGARARCARCRATVARGDHARGRHRLARSAALAALVLYPLAIHLPILRIARFGELREASIWSGTLGLFEEGELLVGLVVFTCSIVFPLLKLCGLFVVTGGLLRAGPRARVFRIIEWAGRWGMLDVLILSVLVAWIQFGEVLRIQPGPGALAFAACVLLSIAAGALLDPHALWEEAEA